jgi:rod shape-determining protein MreC
MKTKFVIIVILLFILTVVLTKNDERITSTLLAVINPIKQNYQNFTQDIEDKSQSYLFQKEAIEKLSKENIVLRKRLLEQTHYLKQVKDIYDILPQLRHMPVQNISIADTISYVKLNSFSQIILTKPENINEKRLYGLIQKNVVGGIAQLKNDQLYGYLTSDKKCRFSVFIGKEKAPGIAEGLQQNEMKVKFIPKWHDIKAGDEVVTSGLDHIFFENIPVGIVTRTELHSSYKIAYIKTYSDIFHPKTFFLINDAKVTLSEGFDSNKTQLKKQDFTVPKNIHTTTAKFIPEENAKQHSNVSSIPKRIDQTQEELIEPETPKEDKKIKNGKPLYKPAQNSDELDLF